jgi:hypothetical protein
LSRGFETFFENPTGFILILHPVLPAEFLTPLTLIVYTISEKLSSISDEKISENGNVLIF